jgi:hypothetical protein
MTVAALQNIAGLAKCGKPIALTLLPIYFRPHKELNLRKGGQFQIGQLGAISCGLSKLGLGQ